MNHLVALVHTLDTRMLAGHDAGTVELVGQHRVENLIHERRFAGSGDAGHAGHHAEGKPDVDVLQIVLTGAHHLQHT